MDKLTIFLLFALFVFGGSGWALMAFICMMSFGFVGSNHSTLFSLSVLMTYKFYGILSLLYTFAIALTFLLCGYMYWHDVRPDELVEQFTVQSADRNEKKTEPVDGQSDKPNETPIETPIETPFERKLKLVVEHKNKLIGVFYNKTGLTDEKIEHYKSVCRKYYHVASDGFNVLCGATHRYLCKFCQMTRNVRGFDYIYTAYDQIVKYKQDIESLKALHKFSNALTVPRTQPHPNVMKMKNTVNAMSNNMSNDDDEMIEMPTLDTDPLTAMMRDLGGLGNLGGLEDMDNLDNFGDMDKYFKNMPDQQKKQIEDMTKQLFGNMNIGDMMGMLNVDGVGKTVTGEKKKGKKKRNR
jgi:hypothetical protein